MSRAGSFSPVVDGTVLPQHPFDPVAPAISKNKPLLIGTNRDETTFMFMNDPTHGVFTLTDASLKERLERELGNDADAVLKTYREARPGASPADLYIAISTASMMWTGSITAAERKYAQGGAPVYMYMLTYRWIGSFPERITVSAPRTQRTFSTRSTTYIPTASGLRRATPRCT